MSEPTELSLGIDLGIASCGWALVANRQAGGAIVDLGVRTFDAPETDKDRTPTNQLRRQHRGLRTVLRRRRQRMRLVRGLFRDAGLLADDGKDRLTAPGLDPWRLRAEGLDRPLAPLEFAVALGHIAKHRGFKSNSKRDRGANAPKDSSAMLSAIEATRLRLKDFRTVGEMFHKDPAFARRKRNRDNDYSRSVLRDDQEREVELLFDRQRSLGNALASDDLKRRFVDAAFFQRPLADSEARVGECPFEPGEKRAARHAYSFELFRLLARLAALRIRGGHHERPLTAEEIAAASADFGAKKGKGMTFARLRKLLRLGDGDRFEGVPNEEERKRDVVSRSGDMAEGTYVLRKVLGDAWRTLLATPDKLDRVAFVLSFREDIASIGKGLEEIGLERPIFDALARAVVAGEFADFRGAGHLSAKACRALIPHLKRGAVYSEACRAAGYDHSRQASPDLDSIMSPVARKALGEAIKQVRAIVGRYGLPDRIHVELARDVGKSREERDEIARGIERRNKEKDRLRAEFKEVVGLEPRSADDLLRFELWREQAGRCLYTDAVIAPRSIVAADNSVQVDHILPWSRSGDDSFINKTLCVASANQEKKGQTPFEWLGRDEARWAAFAARIETNKAMKGRKKRNYLLKDAALLEEKFRPRNLNDTRYAVRLLAAVLTRLYPDDGHRHVFARPGPLTDRLRRAWGIQNLKKGADGKRVADDRHHALDALVVAATSEAALQRLTRAFQESERVGASRDFAGFDPPWPGFVEAARARLASVFVSRAERRRARGEAHAATIRQVGERDGDAVVYERKAVADLAAKDLERVKDPGRNAKLIDALRAWIEAGKPKDRPPLSPKGDPIVKVKLLAKNRPDVLVRGGAADRGEMVRVDVFRKKNSKGPWEFFLVPIYPHQVADAENWPHPPERAVQGGRDEREWPSIDQTFEFLWSIYPMSYLELVKPNGEVIEGYFRSLDRSTGALTISPYYTKDEIRKGIGTRTLRSMRKFQVDRLGRRFEIIREKRTWRGVVCT